MEVRRGARVATTFQVALEGLDAEPTPRKGDISATGVYFETDKEVGAAGTIHWLHLVSADGERRIRVMAYVVRTVLFAHAEGRRIGGAAFEFMPESDEASAQLHDFVRYVLALRHPGEAIPHIAPRLAAQASPEPPGRKRSAAATVRKLSVKSMVLETSWPVEPGESVRVDIVAPGMTKRIRLDGRAVRVAPKSERASQPPRYSIELEVEEESDRPLRHHSSMSFPSVTPEQVAASRASKPPGEGEEGVTRILDNLLSALIVPPPDDGQRQRAHHLSGQISRIRLPTLCSLFEMERMTGELVVRQSVEEVRIYLDRGQIVDIEPLLVGEARRSLLRAVLAWDEGSFEFYVQPVARPDKIGMTTTALLLDLAREEDEINRG